MKKLFNFLLMFSMLFALTSAVSFETDTSQDEETVVNQVDETEANEAISYETHTFNFDVGDETAIDYELYNAIQSVNTDVGDVSNSVSYAKPKIPVKTWYGFIIT